MNYDYCKLKGKIKEVFGSQALYAKAIGLSSTSVSNKLNNLLQWKQKEISKSVDILNIDINEIATYFFNLKVE